MDELIDVLKSQTTSAEKFNFVIERLAHLWHENTDSNGSIDFLIPLNEVVVLLFREFVRYDLLKKSLDAVHTFVLVTVLESNVEESSFVFLARLIENVFHHLFDLI